jgi:quercetin dioxygenase-like cupin family protein
VFTGAGVVTIDGTEHLVSAGSAVHIPGNSEHAIRNTGNGPMRLFYAFAVGSLDQIEYHSTAEERAADEVKAG